MGHYDSCFEEEDDYNREHGLGDYSPEALERQRRKAAIDPENMSRRIQRIEELLTQILRKEGEELENAKFLQHAAEQDAIRCAGMVDSIKEQLKERQS